MAHVVVTDPADTDSAEIIEDLGSKGAETVARHYSAEFDRIYQRLATFPESGPRRPKLGNHLRICVVLPYILFLNISKPMTL